MKTCPQCHTNYDDETLNFCLEDGTMLTAVTTESSAPPPTVMMPPAQQSSPARIPIATQTPEVATAPRVETSNEGGNSKTLLWVGLIFGGIVLVCGGGFAGLLGVSYFSGDLDEKPPTEVEKKPTPLSIAPKGSSFGDPEREVTITRDLGDWVEDVIEGEYISAEKTVNGMELTSKKGYFYVIVRQEHMTYDASTLLTVKNVTGRKAASGYGLVIHSYPDSVLERDYAFVIRSDNGTYRIVQHDNKKERNLVNWTRSSAIRRGKATNSLEIRASGNKMRFYINGKLVKTLRDYTDYKKGVAGVYTSDAIPIAFKTLEIRE